MDWEFVTRHLLAGCIPEAVALIIIFIPLHIAGRRRSLAHIVLTFALCLYFLAVLALTGVCIRGSFAPSIVFMPGSSIVRGPVEAFLNVLLFVPLGLLLPLLYEAYDNLGRVALAAFLISLTIEVAQMFGNGATDVNDLIENTVGACVGYGVITLLRGLVPLKLVRQCQIEGAWCHIELTCLWGCTLLLMLAVQPFVHDALFRRGAAAGEMHAWT